MKYSITLQVNTGTNELIGSKYLLVNLESSEIVPYIDLLT